MATTHDPMMPERDLASDPASRSDAGRTYQIVAMFETFERARAARDRLIEEGVPESEMDLVNRDAPAGESTVEYDQTDEGFWGSIKRFFGGHEHGAGYAEGLRRGHAMLVVRPPFEQHDRIADILEGYDPIDFDAQEEEWRKTGWTGGAPLMATAAEPGHGELGRSGVDRPASEPVEATRSMSELDAADRVTTPTRTGETVDTTARTGTLGTGTPGTGGTLGAGREEAVPIVEERVRVGKREIDRGGVRVRTYMVERPVEQDVTLHEERVEVERRPVDRDVGTLPEDAFRERTIEVSATGEEAVVQKDARVIEEVVVRKDEQDRTETVRDTVRKTEVEVEDTRTGKKTRPTSR